MNGLRMLIEAYITSSYFIACKVSKKSGNARYFCPFWCIYLYKGAIVERMTSLLNIYL